MKPKGAFAVLLVLLLVIAGCSSGNGDSDDTTPDSGQTTDSGDSGGSGDGGTGDTSAGSSDGSTANTGLPPSVSEDFAVGIPPGWELDILGGIGMTNTANAQLLYPQDAYDDIVSFYDQWIAEQPVEYTRTEVETGVLYQRNEMPPVQITVLRDHEERDDVWTALQIAGGNDA